MFKAMFLLIIVFHFVFLNIPRTSLSPVQPDEILWWLPEDTETIRVAKGPFNIPKPGPESLVGMMKLFPFGTLLALENEAIIKQLNSLNVLIGVQGSRNFRNPKSLGSMLYEGCDIFIFQSDVPTAREALIKSFEAQSTGIQGLVGYRVLVCEKKLEKDFWKFYFVFPNPDTLLIATDQNYLAEVLSRMKSKKLKRALPDSLPEWKFVDTNAQFWAIRHYDSKNALKDPTSPLSGKRLAANEPDELAMGVTMSYDPKGENIVQIRYLSTNKNALTIAETYWSNDQYHIKPEVKKSSGDVIEVSYSPYKQHPFIVFLLLAAFGQAIFL